MGGAKVMLSKLETRVMQLLYSQCQNKSAILISPTDLFLQLSDKKVNISQIEKVVEDLNTDGYFDLVYSDRHGQVVYCISLTVKGKNFLRDQKLIKRNLIYKLVVTIVFAFISFFIGVILRKIF
jgi:hypothetical protein